MWSLSLCLPASLCLTRPSLYPSSHPHLHLSAQSCRIKYLFSQRRSLFGRLIKILLHRALDFLTGDGFDDGGLFYVLRLILGEVSKLFGGLFGSGSSKQDMIADTAAAAAAAATAAVHGRPSYAGGCGCGRGGGCGGGGGCCSSNTCCGTPIPAPSTTAAAKSSSTGDNNNDSELMMMMMMMTMMNKDEGGKEKGAGEGDAREKALMERLFAKLMVQ